MLLETPLRIRSGIGVSLIPALIAPPGFTTIYEEPKFFPPSKYSVGFQAHHFAFLSPLFVFPLLVSLSLPCGLLEFKGTLELMGTPSAYPTSRRLKLRPSMAV